MRRATRNSLIALAFASLAATSASAMPFGWISDGPNCGPLAHVPMRDVWLGHFAGGRWLRGPYGGKILDWRDAHVCFSSLARCQSWQRSMGGAFNRVEGYRTCLRIR